MVGGVTAAGTRWVLAEGETGGTAGAETYVLVANPSPADARVRVRVLRGTGRPPIGVERVVVAQTRLTLAMSGVGLDAGERFGVEVESLDGVPIVVERAMYWNADGRWWSAGTAEAGRRLR